jgi:hypothetical protein
VTGIVGLRFVLASSPAVGPLALAPLAAALRDRGAIVATPVAHPDLAPYVRAASSQAPADVLVGYSGGGPRLYAVAASLHPRAIVFMDAGLPADGVAPDADPAMSKALDSLPIDDEGMLPPWPDWWPDDALERLCPDAELRSEFVADCPRVPRGVFAQPIPAPPFEGPCAYLAFGDVYATEQRRADRYGWPTAAVPRGHLAPLIAPDEVADALVDLSVRMLA